MEKYQSILNICNKYGSYSIVDNEIVFEYPDDVSISMENLWKEIDADWLVYMSQEYARNRQAEYPSISELTIALYDESDKAALVAKRNAVKLKYPKP